MTVVDELPVGARTRVYTEGWQSWSPTTWAAPGDPPHRPAEGWQHLMRFRPGVQPPADGHQGEGLLVVDPGDGSPARAYGTLEVDREVPTIRAVLERGHLVVTADGPVTVWTAPPDASRSRTGGEVPAGADGGSAGQAVLAAVGAALGAAAGARASSGPAPRVWCSWYRYFEGVTAADVLENLAALDAHDLDVDVVQVDDGWSLGTGEGTRPRPGFGSLPDVVAAIRDTGRRAGIWLAPFVVGARSTTAREHPDWLVGPAGHNWGDDLVGLDLTHPDVRDHLAGVLSGLRDLGIDYAKLDFLYAGAVPGPRHDPDATPVSAYRSGLALVREVLGERADLLGCGAPLLPSVGLVDAMRVSPDTFHEGGEDGSQGLRGRMSLEARAWQHGRFWTTDPDCLVARPSFALREQWAQVVLAAPGVRGFSDRVAELDARGLELVRDLLAGRGSGPHAGRDAGSDAGRASGSDAGTEVGA
ncbi:glycoside hydrolase family 36 protein [Cellulomonas endophytica]|uniref:glycoside hydrolase family 36 protein n=1 Tax=Cellulomonas endophytica TaxID=2494735 RepID=UPI001011743C|nr:glycoside hydrolase family 36 protein [Cellulomonas endophytica]